MARKAKITRNNQFYSESDFLFDSEIGHDYIKQDINQTIILFRVDRVNTNTDRWGEAAEGGVIYKDPVELNVIYTIEKTRNKSLEQNRQFISTQLLLQGSSVRNGSLCATTMLSDSRTTFDLHRPPSESVV